MSLLLLTSFSPAAAEPSSFVLSRAVPMDAATTDTDMSIVAPKPPTKYKGLYKEKFKDCSETSAYRYYLEWRTDARANWKVMKRFMLEKKKFLELRNSTLTRFVERTKEQVGVVLDIAHPRRSVVADFQGLCRKIDVCFHKAIADNSSDLRIVKNSLMKIIGPLIKQLVESYQQ